MIKVDMYIGIASKMLIGSIGIFMLIRLVGKKAMSELTPFDLLYILILGAIVEEAIYDDKVDVFHVIFALILWGVVVYIVEKLLEKTEKLSTLIQGKPSILIEKGKLNLKEIKNNHFDMEQLRSMLRQNDCYSIYDAYYVILEVNGGLTVIKRDQEDLPTLLLIEEGKIKKKVLNGLHKDEKWLRKELKEQGQSNIENILFCEWKMDEEKFLIKTYDETVHKNIPIDD